jgi:hypothetical protein
MMCMKSGLGKNFKCEDLKASCTTWQGSLNSNGINLDHRMQIFVLRALQELLQWSKNVLSRVKSFNRIREFVTAWFV